MKYKEIEDLMNLGNASSDHIKKLDDSDNFLAIIPMSADNADYQEYLLWVAEEGNDLEAFDA